LGEPVTPLAGRRLRAAHGRRDRITSFRATEEFVEHAQRVAASATLRDMGPVGHYMLKQASAWNEFAVSESLRMLDPS